ncbi:GNAT family N-acetyltransferase [Coriobacterium glomerans]|nr:GNAT family N-acetyltransferase [Coriobacterium glomerans]
MGLVAPTAVAALFNQWDDTLIWSCLDETMGVLIADDADRPSAAAALLGDFRFCAGAPCEGLLRFDPTGAAHDVEIVVPHDAAWERLIAENFGAAARPHVRYATRKEPDVFDEQLLSRLTEALPSTVELRDLDDEALFEACRTAAWSRDLVANFGSFERYRQLGIGVVALSNGIPVSGASSYSRYRFGIEIEVDTMPAERRRGLARACSARLILRCRERGLYPSWDAHSRASLALAEQLGYHLSHPYPVFEVTRS